MRPPTVIASQMLLRTDHPHDAWLVALLRYSAERPYEVTLGMPGVTADWAIARDLLIRGLREPAGEPAGDVRVWPDHAENGPIVVIALNNGRERAHLSCRPATLGRFLRATLRIVPAGQESTHVNVDAWIAALLGGSPGAVS